MNAIDPRLLQLPLVGRHLSAGTLAGQLQAACGPTLLVFLRHFSCIFCREMVRDVMAAASSDQTYPGVLMVCQGDLAEADTFFGKYAPTAPVVCDPSKTFYDGLKLGHGTFAQMFGPRVWACGIRATVKGNTIGNPVAKPVGDPWTMPGVFLVDTTGAILWQHTFQHAGDHPDWQRIPHQLTAAAAPTA
jgi:hypothetical protein